MAPILNTLLAIAALASTVYSAPLDARTFSKAAKILPLNEAAGDLPPPFAQPAIIALGSGTQNYTCNSTTGTFGSNTALADLYDATNVVQSSTKDVISKLYLTASTGCHKEDNPLHLNMVGKHYFDSNGRPNFVFPKQGNGQLQAKKVASIPAPTSAMAGPRGDAHGAVDWLYLTDNGFGVSEKLLSVYRVETAGGKPPSTCQGDEKIEVPYAAEYWFYDQAF